MYNRNYISLMKKTQLKFHSLDFFGGCIVKLVRIICFGIN
jgi:hypothetical protein